MKKSPADRSVFSLVVLLLFLVSPASLQAQDTARYEIEDHFAVVADVGTINTVGIVSNGVNSNGKAVRLYDPGDELSISFNIPQAGVHKLRVWLRSGNVNGPSTYWPNGYIFSLPGTGTVTFAGDPTTEVGPFNAYGTTYWGFMEAEIDFASSGTKSLHIASYQSWAVVDLLEVISTGTPPPPPVSDLVLDLPFAGNANDNSDYSQQVTVSGATLTGDRYSQSNGAYLFDGGNDQITISHNSSLDHEYISLIAWIYLDSYKDDQRIVTKESGTVQPFNNYTLMMNGLGDKFPQFRVGIDGVRQELTSATELPLNTWIHLAATYDGSQMKIYINGQENASRNVSGAIQNTSTLLYIGNSQFYDRHFHGKIDEVKVYSRALNSTEVQDMYQNENISTPVNPSGLTATVASNEVQLTWTDNADNEEGFVLERSINSGSYEFLDSLAADSTAFIDANVGAGATYSYRIAAYNGMGLSMYAESTEVQIPTVPQGDTIRYEIEDHYSVVSDVGSNGNVGVQYGNAVRLFDLGDALSVTFSIPSQGDYRLRVWVRSGGSSPTNIWPDGYLFSLGGTEPITFIGDASTVEGPFSTYGTSHWGFMEATVNFSIPGSEELYIEANSNWLAVDYLEVISLGTSSATPGPPTSFTAAVTPEDNIQLTWTDNSNNEEGFILERKTNTESYVWLDSLTANQTQYTDTTTSAGNTYTYRISAYNTAGNSGFSNEATVTVETPVAGDLILNLPFSGNANDISGNSFNGAVTGAQLSTDRSGAANNAYQFDGTDDVIIVPHDPVLSVEHVTMAAWIFLDVYKYDERIISKEYGTTAPNSSYTIMMSGSEYKNLKMRIGLNGVRYDRLSTSEIPLNTWTHVAASYDGDQIRLYINGSLDATHDVPNGVLHPNTNPVYIGASQFYDRNFQGRIDEAKVYNRALSEGEVLSLYNSESVAAPAVPLPPENLTATPVSLSEVQLTWTDNSDNEERFILERETNSGSYVMLDSLNADTNSYSDQTVTEGNSYTYRLYTFNSAGSSAYSVSNTVTINPPPPSSGLVDDAMEREALSNLFDALGGNSWSIKTNWKNDLVAMDSWHGITVTNGDVTEINLAGNNLKGQLPNTIHILEALEVINLSNNQIKGALPVQMARLPELEALYLNDNELGGIVDLEFSVMLKLKTIHLQNNNFRSIPDYSFNNHVDKSQVSLKAENNKLEFLYIENNLGLTPGLQEFTYIPQQPYGEAKVMGFIAGNKMELKIKMLGNNVYQWEFNAGGGWTPVGTNSSTYEVTSVALSNAGRYRCTISNTIEGTGFEIVSEEIEVKVDGGIVTEINGVPLVNRPSN